MNFYLAAAFRSPPVAILECLPGRFGEVSSLAQAQDKIRAMLLAVCVSGISSLPATAYTIEGKVEHVEQLPAVERKFSPGIQFDQAEELSPNNNWIKIPAWLAGSWSAREETAVLHRDFRNGQERQLQQSFKAKQDFTYGQQIDTSGQIWHYLGVPYTSKTSRSTAQEIHEVKEKELIRADQDQVTFRAVATVLLVDSLSSRIERTYQQESITTYQPIADDRIGMTASTKVFGADGRPQTLQKNEAIIQRYRHFQTINQKDGKDLKALFRQYMVAKGLAALIPEEKARGGRPEKIDERPTPQKRQETEPGAGF